MSALLAAYPKGSLVRKAYDFTKEAHGAQMRVSGEPYFTHCAKVAETVHAWKLDEASVAAALLHDVVEDTEYSLADIGKRFGAEVAFLVDGLTKLKNITYTEKQSEIENLRKFVLSFTRDLRVVIVKLADRLHNMQTLASLPEERQKRLAWETSEIYAPLAYRLGMQKLSGDLEDLAFPYVEPDAYEWITKTLKDSYEDRLAYAVHIRPLVTRLLLKHGIKPISVDSRAKRYASLYKKLLRYDLDIDRIHDLVATRIIVSSVEECYAALGIIHQAWPPLPGRIKDYIARPKPNGYRSLHTTVFCEDQRITEFQIRTQEMHEEAELGISAHWAYQQVRSNAQRLKRWTGVKSRKELLWVEQLRNWQKSFTDQDEFVQSLKVDFFKDRIFAITPQNDIIDLPSGATPVDFAYRIHSDLGDQCTGSRVNGKIVPLDYELKSGDIVEIILQRGKKPSEDWLRFVKTSAAREHIKSTLKIRSAPKTPADRTELDIRNDDRPGYLQDITAVFGNLKINILFLESRTDPRKSFSSVVVQIDPLPRGRLERLLLKLKKIPGTREIEHRSVR